MMDTTDNPVLAIDGGGTRCRFAFSQGQKRVVVETGAANATTDFEGAVRSVQEGLASLAARTGSAPVALASLPAFVGLAGITDPALADRLAHALPLQNARYCDDRPAALRGALVGRDGMVAHCGTGSFLGAQIGGKQRLAGGWGSVLGDEASAQWIGRRALAELLRCADGFSAETPLTQDLRNRFGDSASVVAFARNADPSSFGALAPMVTRHAAAGDAVACSILQSGADYIVSALEAMGWQSGLPICLTGGLGPHYGPFLPEALRPDLAEPLGEPLDGAIALARDHEGGIWREHR